MKPSMFLTMSLLAASTMNIAAGFVLCQTPKADSCYKHTNPSVTVTITSETSNRGGRPLKVSLSAPNTAAFSSQNVSWDWKSLAATVFEKDQRPVILFDGVCNLCNGGVNFAIDHDSKGEYTSLDHIIVELSRCVSDTFAKATSALSRCKVKLANRFCFKLADNPKICRVSLLWNPTGLIGRNRMPFCASRRDWTVPSLREWDMSVSSFRVSCAMDCTISCLKIDIASESETLVEWTSTENSMIDL